MSRSRERWRLNLKNSRHLPKMDMSGKADAYVVIFHGSNDPHTKTVKRSLNPVWDELFYIGGDGRVRLIVKDHDRASCDDEIGQYEIDMNTIAKDQDVCLFLVDDKGKQVIGKDKHPSELWIQVTDLEVVVATPTVTTTRTQPAVTVTTRRTPTTRRRHPAHREQTLPPIPTRTTAPKPAKARRAAPKPAKARRAAPKPARRAAPPPARTKPLVLKHAMEEYEYYYDSDEETVVSRPPPPPPMSRSPPIPVRARAPGGRGGLLAAIRGAGTGALHHVDAPAPASAPAPAATPFAAAITARMAARRSAMESVKGDTGFVQDWS